MSSCSCPECKDGCRCGMPKKRGFLGAVFKKCAMCAGSGAGGFLAGHAGCIITPIVIATAGTTAATGGLSVLMLAFSAAATAGGIYLWHRLRGKTAGTWEKRIVIGSALSGLLISSAMHLTKSSGCEHCVSDAPAASSPAQPR